MSGVLVWHRDSRKCSCKCHRSDRTRIARAYARITVNRLKGCEGCSSMEGHGIRWSVPPCIVVLHFDRVQRVERASVHASISSACGEHSACSLHWRLDMHAGRLELCRRMLTCRTPDMPATRGWFSDALWVNRGGHSDGERDLEATQRRTGTAEADRGERVV